MSASAGSAVRRPRPPRRQCIAGIALVAGGAVLAVAGCIGTLGRRDEDRPPPVFTHAEHAARDLACEDCHATAMSDVRAGMPPLEMCNDCHSDAKDQAVLEAVAAYGARPETARYARASGYDDVIFSHAAHAAKEIECAACHPGATTEGEAYASPDGALTMDACMACHAERGVANDCRTCHEKLDRDVAPASHRGGAWTLEHGPLSRLATGDEPADERCDLCHTRSSCDQCHASDAPSDHGNAFRLTTHGLAAAMDRERCLACHNDDSCDRCHDTESPRSHRAGFFGSPGYGHCVSSCHLPVSTNACVVCHEGTPSHDALSPLMPPDAAHASASVTDCRACHPVLPHPDGGHDCLACHRNG